MRFEDGENGSGTLLGKGTMEVILDDITQFIGTEMLITDQLLQANSFDPSGLLSEICAIDATLRSMWLSWMAEGTANPRLDSIAAKLSIILTCIWRSKLARSKQ